MMKLGSVLTKACAVGVVALLAPACGGGSDGGNPPAGSTGGATSAGGSAQAQGGGGGKIGTGGGSAGTGGGTGTACTTDKDCPPLDTTPAGCAVATCDKVTKACSYASKDADGDGHKAKDCKSTTGVAVQTGDDCNDGDAAIYPGAWDGPSDGTPAHPDHCAAGTDFSCDCAGPGATAACNDGVLPEGTSCVCKPGASGTCDQDSNGMKVAFPGGKPVGACKLGMHACADKKDGKGGQWSACAGTVGPVQFDSCTKKGNDENCNGTPNEGCTCTDDQPAQPCDATAQGIPITWPKLDAKGDPVGKCKRGKQTCNGGKLGVCTGAIAPAPRDCTSALDNDCDGIADNTHDAVCACQPTDSPSCTGGPNACPGTRTCAITPQMASWTACNAPTSCTCKDGIDTKPCYPNAGLGCAQKQAAPCVGGVYAACGVPPVNDTCAKDNDANCDGIPNNGPSYSAVCKCTDGTSKECYPNALPSCAQKGNVTCVGGVMPDCAPHPMTDGCNSDSDENCDGTAHNAGVPNGVCQCVNNDFGLCGQKNGAKGTCAGGTATCNNGAWSCNITAKGADTCDSGNDDSCNGIVNEGCGTCINGNGCTNSMGCQGGNLTSCSPGGNGSCVGGKTKKDLAGTWTAGTASFTDSYPSGKFWFAGPNNAPPGTTYTFYVYGDQSGNFSTSNSCYAASICCSNDGVNCVGPQHLLSAQDFQNHPLNSVDCAQGQVVAYYKNSNCGGSCCGSYTRTIHLDHIDIHGVCQ